MRLSSARLATTHTFDAPLRQLGAVISHSTLFGKEHAAYLPVLGDCLCFFLRHISAARLYDIFREQMDLSPSVSPAGRVAALLHHAPALHKLGQLVARDERLSPEFRSRLQQLETLEPRTPLSEVLRSLGRECKDWRRSGVVLARQPLAEGSVAVIVPFLWREGRRVRSRGVFKLQKPGIRARLEEDLHALSKVAAFLDEECHRYRVPALDYQDTFGTIRTLLLHEVEFETEQANLAEAGRFYSGIDLVSIPALLPFCSPHVTAMERLTGTPVPVHRQFSGSLEWVIAQALVARPLFAPQEAALFHADPHAGNLLVMPGNRLGILDWSLTGRLARRARSALVLVVLAALSLNVDWMQRGIEQIATGHVNQARVADVLNSALRELRWGSFPGITWLTRLLDALAMGAGVRFEADLLLFRKSLLTLEGVLAGLEPTGRAGAQRTLDTVIAADFIAHWWSEWPERCAMPLRTPSPRTHCSALALLSVFSAPAPAWGRWWDQARMDFLKL